MVPLANLLSSRQRRQEARPTTGARFRRPDAPVSSFRPLRRTIDLLISLRNAAIGFVARSPARVQTKLLVAFLAMVALLVALGVVGLQVLAEADHRTEDLIRLQRKIAAYRQVQRDTTEQLYEVASAMLSPSDRALAAALRQSNEFSYDLERLQFVAKDEEELLNQVRQVHDRFAGVITQVIDLVRTGHADEARALQASQGPLADRLERLTNQLVNRAEADMLTSIAASQRAYARSQTVVIAFALGSVTLALALGYAISWSLVGPVREVEARLRWLAAGNFSERVRVTNRDELGALAAGVNRMCEELGVLYQQLETANRHKSEFLANTSHELRTPLNAILGYAELIEDNIYGEVPPKIREVLQRIQSNGRHLLGLINAVLDIAKIEAGRLQLSVADYSMTEVVANVVTATEGLAHEKKLALRAIVPENLPLGEGDERRITQVLLNLVGNAIKFTEAGKVEVRATAENNRFQLTVSDTGPGIPVEEHGRIFEEFHQIDTSSTRTKGGTGLGLAISKKIIEMHGGQIWVESAPGHGSAFHFTLPARMPSTEDVT
jgi:signal transduction histidine kinase